MGVFDKASVPKIMEFPNNGTNRLLGVDLLGCCGLVVPSAPTADSTVVVRSNGQDVSFVFYAAGSTDGSTDYPAMLQLQIDQIVASGTTTDFEDGIELLQGGA